MKKTQLIIVLTLILMSTLKGQGLGQYQTIGYYNFNNNVNNYKQVDSLIEGDTMSFSNNIYSHYIKNNSTYSSNGGANFNIINASNVYIFSNFSPLFKSNKSKSDSNTLIFKIKNCKNKVNRIRIYYGISMYGPFNVNAYCKYNDNPIDSIFMKSYKYTGTMYLTTTNYIYDTINTPSLFLSDSISIFLSFSKRIISPIQNLQSYGQIRIDSVIFEKFIPISLPISISKLYVDKHSNYNELVLVTSSEKNVEKIQVLKMTAENKYFEKIGEIVPVGNSVTENSYSYFDKNIYSKNNYYKIKTIDKDGSIDSSKIVYCYNDNNIKDYSIYPNTVDNNNPVIEIISNNNEELIGKSIFLYDTKGISKKYIIEKGNIVNLNPISKGFYYLKINNYTQKITIE